jgi:hypothetical protein
MLTLTRRFALVAVVALVGLSLTSTPAQAQANKRYYLNGPVILNSSRPINPNWLVGPGLTLRQWAWNTARMGRAYSYVPPYMLGYNPYPQVLNYGAAYPYYGAAPYSPYFGIYNPYAYGAYFSNPYNPYGVYGYSYLYQ